MEHRIGTCRWLALLSFLLPSSSCCALLLLRDGDGVGEDDGAFRAVPVLASSAAEEGPLSAASTAEVVD